jgi:N-acetylglucosaminyldiphosphoundecaprenol N-acetyl-beta-D-mannosaminyltransferase
MKSESNLLAPEASSNAVSTFSSSASESAPNRKVQLLNVAVDDLSMEELLARFDRGTICTIHSDMLMWLQKDREFYEQSIASDYITCDSQILTFATRLLGTPLKQRVSGSDLLPRFYDYHRNNFDITLFLLGGLGDVAIRARDTINRKVGRDIVVGCYSPPAGAEKSEAACQEMVDMINASKASVLVLGLGTPKQERFLKRYRDEMPHVRIFLPLGGALDYEAGTMKRPPSWVSNMGLEWAFRILQEPRKRWRRYLVNDMPVIPLILKQKMGLYRNPFEASHSKEGQR